MPPPIKVMLEPHNENWAMIAKQEVSALHDALGPILMAVHHIGSTSIPGIPAKPIIDLLAVITTLEGLDKQHTDLEQLGYEWWGEYGLSGRRYCTKSDPNTGRRLVQLHCWEAGAADINRHLAFRDHLRRNPEVARAYADEKMRCAALHPDDSHAYADRKSAWIEAVEQTALSASPS
jgi:GrpB-like predicted nucleotidyltransferase (UPF0157 family)